MLRLKPLFSETAKRDFEKLPKNIKFKILKKIKKYSENPDLLFKHSQKIRNPKLGNFRLKIGDYRIIYDIKGNDKMLVITIGHRRDVYKK